MKRITLIVLANLFFGLACSLAQVQNLTVEPNHSTIGFKVPIAGGMTLVYGRFSEFDLKLSLIDGDWTKSGASFIIQAGSIDTGIKGRDEHLRSADFFDVEKYPEIVFKISEIVEAGENTFLARGPFTMHGVTRNLEIPFQVLGVDGNTIGIQVRMKLNRRDFGVGSGFTHSSIENFLADEIDVEINFWTKRDKRESVD